MIKLTSYIALITETNNDNELDYLAVVSARKTKVFLINELIYNFLKHFESPNTLENVITFYTSKVEIASKKDLKVLESKLSSFYNDLLQKRWLVDENKKEPEIIYKTLFEEGDTFLNFKVKSILGNKKLTDVYLVTDIKTNKTIVLKMLNKDKFGDSSSFDKYEKHFKIEYDFLGKFNSNYINKGLAFSNYKEHPYFLLKMIKGQSISRYIWANKLTTAKRVKLVLKILKAFSIIHNSNVYHGDIHFSNVMVSKTGQPTIIDFGYANEVAVDGEKTNEKPKNGGVYAFIPPERAIRSLERRFSEVTQFQSEVYQIGLIIYFIFNKRLPFEARTWKKMVDEKQAFTCATHAPFLKKRMPKQIKAFIIKCLENNPEKRYNNAKSMHKSWQIIAKKY